MISRRGFFGALAGSAALAANVSAASTERMVPGWEITWSGWREPVNQFVKVGFWFARMNPMPDRYNGDVFPCWYSTTLGVVEGARDRYALDISQADRNAPIIPTDDPRKFEAAKVWARKRLIEKLESL